VAAIAVLCAGDGLADIVGRRLGTSNKLPYSPNKVRAGCALKTYGNFYQPFRAKITSALERTWALYCRLCSIPSGKEWVSTCTRVSAILLIVPSSRLEHRVSI
jgi:dolichol kinase